MKLIALALVFTLIASMAHPNGHGFSNSAPTMLPEVALGEVKEDTITIHWSNQQTFSLAEKQLFQFETEHGTVTLEIFRTDNGYKCDNTICKYDEESAADILTVLETPEGWVSELGFSIKMYERSSGTFNIIRWAGM